MGTSPSSPNLKKVFLVDKPLDLTVQYTQDGSMGMVYLPLFAS